MRFDRENDQVTVDCAADKALNAITESITVEAWIKHKYGNCLIVSRCDNAGQGYILGWHEQKIRVSMQSASSSTRIIIDTRENAPSDCNWHHVAFSWDCKSQEIVTYIDGKLQESFIVQGQSKSTVHEGQHRNIGLFAGPVGNFEANLVIGCRHKEEDNYDIAIAEVRLWRVPRSQNQVKVGMARRLKGNENGLIAYWRLDDGDKNNRVARNLVADKSSGNIQGATWFPK